MSASNRRNHIYLMIDAGNPVAVFTLEDEMRTYLKRRHGTFNDPLVDTFGGEHGAHAGHHDHVEGVGRMIEATMQDDSRLKAKVVESSYNPDVDVYVKIPKTPAHECIAIGLGGA